jgi:hypothetical protein
MCRHPDATASMNSDPAPTDEIDCTGTAAPPDVWWPVERRAFVRYLCNLQTLFKPGAVHPGLTRGAGVVRNLSAHGIGVALDVVLDLDTIVQVQLRSAAGDFSCDVLARVVHVTPTDRGWLHGCALARRLADDELSALLR